MPAAARSSLRFALGWLRRESDSLADILAEYRAALDAWSEVLDADEDAAFGQMDEMVADVRRYATALQDAARAIEDVRGEIEQLRAK